MCSRDRSDCGQGLQHTSLVIGKHDGHERWARISGQKIVECLEHNDTIMVDRDALGSAYGTKGRIVLDRGDQDALAPAAQQRKMVRLGATADKDNSIRRHTEQCPDSRARVLDRLPRGAAPAVNRGWVAATGEHRGHDRCRLGPQRGGGVPIEISLGPRPDATARPSSCVHYVPVAVALPNVSRWRRPLLPSTRCSHTSASETELR